MALPGPTSMRTIVPMSSAPKIRRLGTAAASGMTHLLRTCGASPHGTPAAGPCGGSLPPRAGSPVDAAQTGRWLAGVDWRDALRLQDLPPVDDLGRHARRLEGGRRDRAVRVRVDVRP